MHLSVDIVDVESLARVASPRRRFLPHPHQLLRLHHLLHMEDRKLEIRAEIS